MVHTYSSGQQDSLNINNTRANYKLHMYHVLVYVTEINLTVVLYGVFIVWIVSGIFPFYVRKGRSYWLIHYLPIIFYR